MNELFYVIVIVLLGAGASIGDKIDRSSLIDQPLNPVPLRVVSGAAGLVATAWIIYGFFSFSWWLPILGIVTFTFVGGLIIFHAMRSYHAPLVGILSSMLGFACAIGVLATGA